MNVNLSFSDAFLQLSGYFVAYPKNRHLIFLFIASRYICKAPAALAKLTEVTELLLLTARSREVMDTSGAPTCCFVEAKGFYKLC